MNIHQLFHNAFIPSADPFVPAATKFMTFGGRIVWIGSGNPPLMRETIKKIDCEGAKIFPGFIDAHCHPLALGASMSAVDCSPRHVRSIKDLQSRIREAAREFPGQWIKAVGYDELLMAEGRHPTRADLDIAVKKRPVRLIHSSGHALVLNTKGLEEIGIDKTTTEPPRGTIAREAETGEVTGLLLEMNSYVNSRMPRPSALELARYSRKASDALLSRGITSVTDAGYTNHYDRLEIYRNLHKRGTFKPRPTVMLAPNVDRTILEPDAQVRAGAAKVMFTVSNTQISDSIGMLKSDIEDAISGGAQMVAVHAVEKEALIAICHVLSGLDQPNVRFRIEHASEASKKAILAIANIDATVVTQPGLLYERGERYRKGRSRRLYHPADLYPLRAFIESGITLAGGSDAPYGPYSPFDAIACAVDRRSRDGFVMGQEQTLTIEQAFAMFTSMSAVSEGIENERGRLLPGMLADFTLLDRDLYKIQPEEIRKTHVLRTVIGGRTVWPPSLAA